MKALWIRVEAHDVDSREISRFAIALGVSKVMALGHSTALAGAIAEQTEDGRIDTVTDEELEQWSRWGGKGGRLAKAVRDHLQAPDGTYRDWTDSMGKLVERRAKDRIRKQLPSEQRAPTTTDSVESPRQGGGNAQAVPRNFRGDSAATRRDETVRNDTTTSSPPADFSALGPLHSVLASDADRTALDTLLALVPTPRTWYAEMVASLDGMAGHVHVDIQQLGLAIRDFLGNGAAKNANLRHFRRYLEQAVKPDDPRPPNRSRKSAPTPGENTYRNAKAALDDFPEEMGE